MSDNSELTVKRGFQLHPELINKNGAPKKEESITGLVQELLRNKPTGQEKTYRELFAMRVMKLALEGDMTAIREIWDRMEGSVRGKFAIDQLNLQVNNYQVTPEEVKEGWIKAGLDNKEWLDELIRQQSLVD